MAKSTRLEPASWSSWEGEFKKFSQEAVHLDALRAAGAQAVGLGPREWTAPSSAQNLEPLARQVAEALRQAQELWWTDFLAEAQALGRSVELPPLWALGGEPTLKELSANFYLEWEPFTLVIDWALGVGRLELGGYGVGSWPLTPAVGLAQGLSKLEESFKAKAQAGAEFAQRLAWVAQTLEGERHSLEELWPGMRALYLLSTPFARTPNRTNAQAYSWGQYLYEARRLWLEPQLLAGSGWTTEGSLEGWSWQSQLACTGPREGQGAARAQEDLRG